MQLYFIKLFYSIVVDFYVPRYYSMSIDLLYNSTNNMDVSIVILTVISLAAFICEVIDAGIGMGYGTILSPLLIIFGYDPSVSVPAILISQALGGLIASVSHHKANNVSFKKKSKDLNIAIIISLLGVSATIFASFVSLNISKIFVKSYIGLLITIMGIIILRNKKYTFSWRKIWGIGILSSFNKGLTGGGFGPVTTAGQIMSGQNYTNAIGTTTLAEAPICIAGFLSYIIISISQKNLSIDNSLLRSIETNNVLDYRLIFTLTLGAILAAPIGVLMTKKLRGKRLHIYLGITIVLLGLWSLYKTFC